jgi:DNA-binding response OmpR family regulator
VDDDDRIRDLLRRWLTREGFRVTTAPDAAAARRLVQTLDFDLVVVDVMMPGEDGFSLTRWLRKRSPTPVLILTARGLPDDRIEGLSLGADDYLAKPFEPRELEARLEALLRRAGAAAAREADGKERIAVGDLVIDKRRHEVTREGAVVDLTPLEFQILERLASEPGRAWSRNDLLDQVWSTDYEGYQRNVDPHINRLRQKIEPDPKNPRFVLTVRGVGYKLNDAL